MSLAQYASPYNNDDSGETDNINANIRMTQSQGQNKGGGGKKMQSSSSFRKTIKRPLTQQQQQQQQHTASSQSRVANFMSKLSAVNGVKSNYLQGDDGTSGMDESENDLADYQPMNEDSGGNQIRNQNQNQNQMNGGDENNDDGVVTRENFENLPSTYASQYYQQYVPLSYNQELLKSSNQSDYVSRSGSRDDLVEKMNHIIQMLEDQQDEKTGSVTEELILYCFLGVFVIFVVDSFVRAGKYVR